MNPRDDASTYATDLIGSMLAAAEDIGLNEHQIAALSHMYWNSAGQPSAQLVKEAAGHLSAEQFREAVAGFAQKGIEPGSRTAFTANDAQPFDLDTAVATALDKRIKDRSVVEVELASRVADRLISWSKTFGVFFAAPVGVLLLILSLFGISKFDDIRTAATTANKLFQEFQQRLDESKDKLTDAVKRADELTQRATERAKDIDQQLATLHNASTQAQTQIASLGQSVRQIETKLGGVSAQQETGNRPSGSILRSPISKLYGPWGINEQSALELVSEPVFPWHDDFKDLQKGTPEFDAAWSNLGKQEPERFKDAQHSYLQNHYVDPAMTLMKSTCGMDLTTHSRALQEAVWVQALRMGPKIPELIEVCRSIRDRGLDPTSLAFEEALIRQSFEKMIEKHMSSRGEMTQILDQLSKEPQKK